MKIGHIVEYHNFKLDNGQYGTIPSRVNALHQKMSSLAYEYFASAGASVCHGHILFYIMNFYIAESAMRATSQLPGEGPLMPLHLHVYQKHDDDDNDSNGLR